MVIGKTDLKETSWEDIMKMASKSIVKWVWDQVAVSADNTLKSTGGKKKKNHLLPVLELSFAEFYDL